MRYDFLIVGAGFAGCVMAREITDAGMRVRVIDRRPHIGGNAYDSYDGAGCLIHNYGPHIFHTNSEKVFEWLSRFTAWRPYEHRVRSFVAGRTVPFPINMDTLNTLYPDLALAAESDVQAFFDRVKKPVERIRNSEDIVVSQVGQELYELFFRGYSRKQWNRDPSTIAANVAGRIPVRTNRDDRYFTDRFQFMPREGYTRMFERMMEGIDVATGTEFKDTQVDYDRIVWTGPIDEFWGYRFGRLPYRSLEFEHRHFAEADHFQECGTVNYPSEDVPYTRITEFKYLTGQKTQGTSIVYEYPRSEGDPYYPVPSEESHALFAKYRALRDPRVTFVGRLAQYQYYNMDQVTAAALKRARDILSGDFTEGDA